MSAIEEYRGHDIVAQNPHDMAISRLSEWARSADAAMHVAETLTRSSFVPEAFRGKPHEATAAILAGLEVGLQPMASLRSFDVIQGQAAPRALALRAIVQSFGHDIVLDESTATRCKVRGRRKGSHDWQTVTWTLDRAKALKLTNKPNWQNQPQAMLVARATSEMARLIAADAILGIGYSAEELADGGGAGVEVAAETVTPSEATTTTRKMSRKKAEPADDGPPIVDAEVVEVDPGAITDKQMRMMLALLSKAGIVDRADKLTYASAIAGRELATSKDLTKDEASKVIDALNAVVADLPQAADDVPPPLDEVPA